MRTFAEDAPGPGAVVAEPCIRPLGEGGADLAGPVEPEPGDAGAAAASDRGPGGSDVGRRGEGVAPAGEPSDEGVDPVAAVAASDGFACAVAVFGTGGFGGCGRGVGNVPHGSSGGLAHACGRP